MAASGYTPIQIYHSTTASAAPTAGNLVNGELAINILDGKLYYKDNGGVVQVIATKGTGTIGGSTTQVQYNNTGALAGSANFTFDGTTATINTLNLTNALGAAYGGTAQSTYAQGDLLYASAANTLAKLPIGISTYILTSNGSIPGWSIPSSVVIGTATNLAGGAAGSVPYQSGAGTTTFLTIGTANQVVTSTGSAPQWSSALTLTGLSNSGLTTLDKTVTVGNTSFNGAAVFAPATPAKVYLGTGTVTDVTSAIAATNAAGAIVALGVTPIAATNANVTYTNASTLYIAGAPSAGTNITITNPYALYVAAGDAYFGASVSATTLDLTNLEVTNIKAKDGTASMSIADSTGVVTFSANPVLNAGTANGVPYLSSPGKVLTTGSALTFDGTDFSNTVGKVISASDLRASTSGSGNIGLNLVRSGGTAADWYNYIPAGTNDLAWFRGSELMRLTSTGLGIGTSSPAGKLTVKTGTNENLSVVTGGSGDMRLSALNDAGSATVQLSIQGSPLYFRGTGGAINATLDSSGNLGLGVTPSAWQSTFGTRALQFTGGAVLGYRDTNFILLQNAYFDGGFKYYASSIGAAYYDMSSGAHKWFRSTSAQVINTDPVFDQAMTLDASGNLVVGATSTSYRMEVVAPSGDNVIALFRSGDATAANNAGGGFRSISSATAASRVAQVWLDADGANLSGGDYFYIQKNGNSGTADIVQYSNSAMTFATNATERARITSGGDFQTSSGNSVMVGGTAARATTAGTNRVDIFDGTAPVGTLANGVSFYSASGEANVMDAAGNATLLSPHDAETNEWIFRSKHTPTGKVLKIDVERLLKFVNDHFGLDAVHEFVEK